MPIKLKKTVSTSAVTGNSVQFNGSNQYLSIANNAAFNLSTNNFTAEAWVYLTNSNAQQTIVGQWSGLTGGTTLSWIILTSNDANRYARFLISNNGSGVIGDYISTNAIPLNTWSHLALVRNGSAFNLYLNGISVVSTSTSLSVYYATNAITIGATSNPGQFLGGYISNLRILNGIALYTSNFTPSTSPLTAIANTSILTCQSPTIIDNSTNNFTITNNNTATVSSAVVPFTTSRSVFKLKKNNANPVAPYSVLFNGSSQYLSVANNAAFDFGAGDFTIEGWVNLNSTSSQNLIGKWWTGGQQWVLQFRQNGQDSITNQHWRFYANNGSSAASDFTEVSTTSVVSSTWYHIALTRSGSSYKFFRNGTQIGSTYTNAAVITTTTDPLTIGQFNNTGVDYFNGYFSNVRILKGTALYTSNFTPPTSPLTAITNTSLLTCNAATIVDNSSNNFTITNNNSATVSSTTPFTASISTNKFKLRQVSYSPYMIATGGDLVTTSGSYKIHTFTTVGTSSFVVSAAGIAPTVECLLVGGGGGAGYWGGAGGGAGGVVYTASFTVSASSYNVVVGIGGSGSLQNNSNGVNGNNTLFGSLTSLGGGGGGSANNPGASVGNSGGSGGGGGSWGGVTSAGGSGLQPASTSGGYGSNGGTSNGTSPYGAGGGGGAGGVGGNAAGSQTGNGGVGISNALLNSALVGQLYSGSYYVGGGGGAGGSSQGSARGLGGAGGGANGTPHGSGSGSNGMANTGGGGGGGQNDPTPAIGGSGGSGVVVIKYRYTA